MRVSKYFVSILISLVYSSCIDPFQPVIEESQEVLVINGVITDRPGMHQVIVSRSSPYNDPVFMPVSGCVVRVEDDRGNMAVYSETEPGIYGSYLDASFLEVDRSYSLYVITTGGKTYQSDYDTLLACPPIDSIYFEVKSQGTSDPEKTLHGIQFYNNVTGTITTSRNFRYLLNETWQYTSPHVAAFIWSGGPVLPNYTDSIHTCYMSNSILELFSASTRSLSVNDLKRNPLNYVSNETPRIMIRYSLLVEQQSLTNEAFHYWEKMKAQSGDAGGLYESQPSSTTGNIYNINNPEEKVLGCFYATQQQRKRLVVDNDFDFVVPRYTCELDTVNSISELKTDFPYYLISINEMGVGPPYLWGNQSCFDCRLYGGTTEKPDYW